MSEQVTMATRRSSPPKKSRPSSKKAPAPVAPAPSSAAPSSVARAKPPPSKPVRPSHRPTGLPAGLVATGMGLPTPEWMAVEGVGDERRRFQRVAREMKVRLFAGASAKNYLEAHLESVDMSLSGIYLRSTFFLPEGTPVRIEFDGPWGQKASANGEVARIQRDGERSGFGIHFTNLDEESMTDLVCMFVGDRIEQFVAQFGRRRGGSVDGEMLWEGILAWELERLKRAVLDR